MESRENRRIGKIPITDAPLAGSEQLAFLVGMILGDGHIAKFPRSERLRIMLGIDKPLLWQHIAKVARNVFAKEPWVQQRKQEACVEISLYQTRLSERLGVPTGDRWKLSASLSLSVSAVIILEKRALLKGLCPVVQW